MDGTFFRKSKLFGVLNSGNLTYDPSIWLKVTSLSSVASKRERVQKNHAKKEFECTYVKMFSFFFSMFLARLCLFTESDSLHFAYWVISLPSGTSAASITSVALMTSTASFHQKLTELDVSISLVTKVTYPSLVMWDGSTFLLIFGTLSLAPLLCGQI